jgi:hypothetical protein
MCWRSYFGEPDSSGFEPTTDPHRDTTDAAASSPPLTRLRADLPAPRTARSGAAAVRSSARVPPLSVSGSSPQTTANT